MSKASKHSSIIQRVYDYLFKIVIVGDSGVGKSCLLIRFADDMWTNNYIATIGVDFRFRTIQVRDKTVKLQIWDTAGHERFQSINASYFRGCDGAILCYDVCRKDTFRNIVYHLDQIQQTAEKHCAKIIVGNKTDMKEFRQVPCAHGIELSQQLGIPFFEISAKFNRNVDAAFLELAGKCIAEKIIDDKWKSDHEKELKQLQNNQTPKTFSFQQIKESIQQYNGRCC
eukprot:279675_1